MTELATLHRDNAIARLTLNRPDKRNALSIELLDALHQHVDALHDQPNKLNACIIDANGPSFCAGMDLKAVLKQPGAPLQLLNSIAELTIKLRTLPMIVIAQAHGAAIGGGCGIVAVADIALSHPDAKLGYPEVELGVCPAVVAPWLTQRVGHARARRILLAGGVMSGQRAHELALVDELHTKETLPDAANKLADTLAKAGNQAIRATKALLNELETPHIHQAVRRGAQISADVIAGPEAQQRLNKLFA